MYIQPVASNRGNLLFHSRLDGEIENLEKRFSEKIIFKNVNLTLDYGEKVALLGKNGSGKSTLIKMILNEDNNFNGEIHIGSATKIGYIPQNIIFKNQSRIRC